MNNDQRQEAIFGAWDGVVSIVGFIFALLANHSPESAIAIGGFGGAIAAGVSMASGEFAKSSGPRAARARVALAMLLSTLVGSLVPIWPFFLFGPRVALFIAALGCVGVATWIGFEKRQGILGYLTVFVTLFLATSLTLVVVSLLPQSV
jgi:VIT1/CCC1 family predicted Fe2+/Mn2+ transporter